MIEATLRNPFFLKKIRALDTQTNIQTLKALTDYTHLLPHSSGYALCHRETEPALDTRKVECEKFLDGVMEIQGAMAAALLDTSSGALLCSRSHRCLDMVSVAADFHAMFLCLCRSQAGKFEGSLLRSASAYQLLRVCRLGSNGVDALLCLVLEREKANLALAQLDLDVLVGEA